MKHKPQRMGPALSLIAAAPTIIQTSQDAILGVVRQNTSEQQFNNYFDGIQRNPFNRFVNNTVCGSQTANSTLGFLGYDCHHWDQFDHNIAEAEAAAAAAAAAAAQAEADAAFAANFDAAWSAHMAELNKPPPILRDAQGTPLEPEGPARVQGFPQRIPKNPGVQTKALPEDEPQRVYNQDDSSEVPQLAIAQKEPGLPLMTVGIVATGGVLIFLWSTKKR